VTKQDQVSVGFIRKSTKAQLPVQDEQLAQKG
jgi:hypothetical protein